MHKRTFLKPAIKDSKFCSTCHKVGLPYALNHYKDFLRGQNHWDTLPPLGRLGPRGAELLLPAGRQGRVRRLPHELRRLDRLRGQGLRRQARPRGPRPRLPRRQHRPGRVPRRRPDVEAHAKYLADKKVRVDLFALREGGGIDGALLGPLRPEVPTLKPGKPYLVEAVVRTLGLGHPLSQGTVDSNEIWVELIARAGDRVIGRSGGIGDDGTVDPYAHFINVYMLDRDGNRVDRRNPQDIFVPLYNKQVPPGAGQVVHFGLDVPPGIAGPITLEAKVNYRKFDRKYLDYIFGAGKGRASRSR